MREETPRLIETSTALKAPAIYFWMGAAVRQEAMKSPSALGIDVWFLASGGIDTEPREREASA